MKSILPLLLYFLAHLTVSGEPWSEIYDALLQNYATPTGVHYQKWHQSDSDRQRLAMVVEQIGDADLKGQSKEALLAFYLNAYNAWILHRILETYPTDGPGGGGFFGRNRFFRSNSIRVAGKKTSFHRLENDVIRPEFREPRIHFALNCASRSCPPLHTRAFTEENLDATLTQLTKTFINRNPLAIRFSSPNEIAISEIFNWYADDFETSGSILDFLNDFRETPIPKDTKIRYQDYQWTLNKAIPLEKDAAAF